MGKTRCWLAGVALLAAVAAAGSLLIWIDQAAAIPPSSVRGVVLNPDGPVAGASVRVRATEHRTFTDENGEFILDFLIPGEEVEIAAWFDGFYITSTHVTPPARGVVLRLRPYHRKDHPAYVWADPITGTGACIDCHPMIVDQWAVNAHGGAVSNARFFSLYNGTDLTGSVQIGPGFANDFPENDGVCASCHAPGMAVDGYLTTNMNDAREMVTAGIHCDYCHKLGGVYVNPGTATVYPNAPGVESSRVLRPPTGDNIFFGPYDDIKDPDTYLPEISESRFCAPCHQFSFWGTPVYESFNEWLASPYAAEGVTCQKCHMPPNGDEYFALPEKGGLPHPPETIPSHLQLGARSQELLENTVEMGVDHEVVAGQIRVTVVLTNTGAGHHVPTDFPGRQMILLVRAEDETGAPLPLAAGPLLPEWAGAEAGLPGMAYAKVLRDALTGELPVVSYWKQALVDSDNRIPASGISETVYHFDLPPGSEYRLDVRLLFRRVFADLSAQKGWDMPDLLMEWFQVPLPDQ